MLLVPNSNPTELISSPTYYKEKYKQLIWEWQKIVGFLLRKRFHEASSPPDVFKKKGNEILLQGNCHEHLIPDCPLLPATYLRTLQITLISVRREAENPCHACSLERPDNRSRRLGKQESLGDSQQPLPERFHLTGIPLELSSCIELPTPSQKSQWKVPVCSGNQIDK